MGNHAQEVAHTVDILKSRIVEDSEAEFDHVGILGIKSRQVEESRQVSELISLFEAQFGIYTFFGIHLFVRVHADTADVLTGIFLGQRGIAVALPEAGADKAVVGKLVVQSGAEDRFDRNLGSEQFGIRFPQVTVHPVVFGTHAGRYAQAVEETLVVLDEQGGIVAVVRPGGFRNAFHVFVGCPGGDLTSAVPFLIELVVYIVGVVFVRPFGNILLVVVHHPGDQVAVIGCRGSREYPVQDVYGPVHDPVQVALQYRLDQREERAVVSVLDVVDIGVDCDCIASHIA